MKHSELPIVHRHATRAVIQDPATRRLATAFTALMLLDVATTLWGLHVGLQEANPVFAGLLSSLSLTATAAILVAAKAAGVAAILLLAGHMPSRTWRLAGLAWCVAVMVLVVAWNGLQVVMAT